MKNIRVAITDDQMKETLSRSKRYSVLILHRTEKYYTDPATTEKMVREHGRRNLQLRADGLLSIVCAIRDDTDTCGIGVFNATLEEVKEIYAEDPCVKAGIFTFEVHPGSSFPGDALPK